MMRPVNRREPVLLGAILRPILAIYLSGDMEMLAKLEDAWEAERERRRAEAENRFPAVPCDEPVEAEGVVV